MTEEVKTEAPNYYAVITAKVRYDKRLKPMEKLIYAEISALVNMNGVCFASNAYFASLYDCTEKAISCYISNLKKYGYIEADYIMNGSRCDKRYIKITGLGETPTEKPKIKKEPKEKKEKKVSEKKKPLAEREPENELEEVEKAYWTEYKQLHDKGIVQSETPIVNWSQARRLETNLLKTYGKETLINAIKKASENDFILNHGYCLTTILSAGVLSGLVNGIDTKPKNKTIIGVGVDKYIDNGVDF